MESFADLFENSSDSKRIRPGSILDGKIEKIGSNYVTVYAGLKSDCNIPLAQFRDTEGNLTIEVGDSVEVSLDTIEDGFGITRLSRERAKRERAWEALHQAYENGQPLSGLVSGKIKGGFTVDLGEEIRAFLPGSLVERSVRDTNELENQTLDFKIIKIDQRRNNVVVSRRAIVDAQHLVNRAALMEKLVEGAILPGVIKNLTNYGAFVDLGGIDGLLHVTDMAWQRVRSPDEMVNIGDQVKVRVLKFDPEKNRVSLGLKQLEEDPWVDISERFPKDSKVTGTVTNITDYGFFVKLGNCIEGLVHVSEMGWTNKKIHPSKAVQCGEDIEVVVLNIDVQRRRLSLGLKQCLPNPWVMFFQQYNKGDKISGEIKSIANFGLFVGLLGGIDGLVHLSDLSWNIPPAEAIKKFYKGDIIEVMVLLVDPERERILLGIKQLEKDAFIDFVALHGKGTNVTGTVTGIKSRCLNVNLSDGVEGRIETGELSSSHDKTDDLQSLFNEGDSVTAKITHIDRKARLITLSIKELESEEEAQVLSKYSAGGLGNDNTIGDITKNQGTFVATESIKELESEEEAQVSQYSAEGLGNDNTISDITKNQGTFVATESIKELESEEEAQVSQYSAEGLGNDNTISDITKNQGTFVATEENLIKGIPSDTETE